MTPTRRKITTFPNTVIPQDNLYIIAWEMELETNFDHQITYQDPYVIDSRRIIKNIIPANPRNRKLMTVKILSSAR